MTSIKPKSQLSTQAHVAELAAKAGVPVDPVKEAGLAAAILALGPDATLLNEKALDRVRGLDEGLRARAILMALTTAYGQELTPLIFKSGSVSEFATRLAASTKDILAGAQLAAVNHFLATFDSEKAFLARDGQEIPLWTIAEAQVHPAGAYPSTREARLLDKNDKPVEPHPLSGSASFSDGTFGVVRLGSGAWSAWFQNDWNRDLVPLDELSSASLQAIRDHLGPRAELRGLAAQVDQVLSPRLDKADRRQLGYEFELAKLDLDALAASGPPVDAAQLMALPAPARVARHDEGWLRSIIKRLSPPQLASGQPEAIGSWSQRELTFGDRYAYITHATQPLSSTGAHLQWTVAGAAFPSEGGLVELAGGEYRLWQFDPVRRRPNGPDLNYYPLEALDRDSLVGLREVVARLAPSGGEDSVMRTARQAHPYGASYARLLQQIDRALASADRAP